MKRTVRFRRPANVGPKVGESAIVFPFDHPDSERVSNRDYAITSEVVKVNEDGSFETLNSKYIPV